MPSRIARLIEAGVLGGAATAWTPSKVTGLQLWLRADAGVFTDDAATTPATADGNVVAVWKDQSGNGYDISQTTNEKRPLLRLAANGINGRAAVLFDGSNDIMVRTVANWLSSDSAGTLAAVYRLPTLVANSAILASADEAGSGNYIFFHPYRNVTTKTLYVRQINADTEGLVRGGTDQAVNTTYLVVWRSSGTAYTIRENNGNEVLTVVGGANNGDWFADTANRDNFSIGAMKFNNTETFFTNALISEVILYNSNLTGADLTNLETYLNTRYAAF